MHASDIHAYARRLWWQIAFLRSDLRAIEREFALKRMRMRLASEAIAVRAKPAAIWSDGHHWKAGFDPGQPRVPAGHPDGGQWTSGSGSAEGEQPAIPEDAPLSAQLRNTIVKEVVRWLARAAVKEFAGPIGTFLNLAEAASWLYEAYPYVRAYFEPPRSLDELQQAVSTPARGYDIHHIVEQTSAEQAGYPRELIDGPDNRVRIPTLKHWQITGWYMARNEQFGGMSPRAYLRDREWSERVRVGQAALVKYGVLKP